MLNPVNHDRHVRKKEAWDLKHSELARFGNIDTQTRWTKYASEDEIGIILAAVLPTSDAPQL